MDTFIFWKWGMCLLFFLKNDAYFQMVFYQLNLNSKQKKTWLNIA